LALLRVEPGGNGGEAFCSSFLLLVCLSQQTHAFSHMKRSELPPVVLYLQEKGVLIGRKAHGAHHKPNFEGNYAIVSGMWHEPAGGKQSVRYKGGIEKFSGPFEKERS
jgi:sterol desaturase/sphingolipid hydroxylase (fatty acid hydroxylase superfamily)